MNYDRKVLYKKLYKTMDKSDNLVNLFASEKANGNFKKYLSYRGKYYGDFYNILENFFDEIRERRKDDLLLENEKILNDLLNDNGRFYYNILSDFGALLKNSFYDLTNEELEDLLERMENYIIDFIDYENGYY